MKIYTKMGDGGTTSLSDGKRIIKCDSLLNAYGTVDELNSFLGLLISENPDEFLTKLQNFLFVVGGMLATPVENWSKYWDLTFLDRFTMELEAQIDRMSANLEPLQGFILPQGNCAIGYAHVCRTVCRRAEREIVSLLTRDDNYVNVQKVLNRLSDFFFVYARFLHQKFNIPENHYQSVK